jgi:putative membrane protein
MTTASNAAAVPFTENRFLVRLCVLMIVILFASASNAVQAFDWWLESALALIFLIVLGATYQRLALSDLSYLLILVFITIHEVGAHYKYAFVPMGEWMKPWVGAERNSYDRLAHFSFGFLLSYPMQEWFIRSTGVQNGFRYFLPIQFTMACSAVYEIMEAVTATILSPAHGQEFVGMQGDIWDAQEDMLMAGLGSVVAMALLAAVRKRLAAASLIQEPVTLPLPCEMQPSVSSAQQPFSSESRR